MQNLDRLSARGKVLAATAAAFLMLSIASPAMADSTRWRTIVGIVQAGNTVLDFDVQGLVLAGGNTIGTPGAVNQVMGTLLCDAGGANLAYDTTPVPLSPQGDADFSGPIGPIASTCNSSNVAFLIRIPAGRWIANGAVRTSQGGNN